MMAAKWLRPALDEYRAAIDDVRVALDQLRPVLAAVDDVAAAARHEEVDQTLRIIACDMRRHDDVDALLRARLVRLVRRGAARRRRAREWLVGRLLGALLWL